MKILVVNDRIRIDEAVPASLDLRRSKWRTQFERSYSMKQAVAIQLKEVHASAAEGHERSHEMTLAQFSRLVIASLLRGSKHKGVDVDGAGRRCRGRRPQGSGNEFRATRPDRRVKEGLPSHCLAGKSVTSYRADCFPGVDQPRVATAAPNGG